MRARKAEPLRLQNQWVNILTLRKGMNPRQRAKLLRQWRFAMRDAVLN